jgi:sugar/nucleoside kinase (ribokinase family)
MAPLQVGGDAFDQRVVLEALEHLDTRLEHHLQELLLVILGVVREQDVGEDLIVRLGKLVEVHDPSIGSAAAPTVLVVGAASRDLDPADPRGWRLGGGVTYGSLAAARLGLAVRALVGVDAEAEEAHELDLLRRAGVELCTVRLASGPVFDNQPLAAGGRRQVAHARCAALPGAALPPAWREPAAALLNPVAGELGNEWAGAFASSTSLALGWQGLMRRLVPGRPVEPLPIRPGPLLARADLALVSAEDAVAGAGTGDTTLPELLVRPGQQLLISHGSRPALLVTRHERGFSMRLLPVTPAATVIDATGAGDILLAAWTSAVAGLAAAGRRAAPAAALRLAMAAASLHVERRGLAGVPTLAEVCERLVRRPS